jgi:hypothetical protein
VGSRVIEADARPFVGRLGQSDVFWAVQGLTQTPDKYGTGRDALKPACRLLALTGRRARPYMVAKGEAREFPDFGLDKIWLSVVALLT